MGRFDEVKIDQYSGDLEVEYIQDAEFILKYGSAKFEELGNVRMELYEQDVTSDLINNLDVDAKYSDVKISDIKEVEIVPMNQTSN